MADATVGHDATGSNGSLIVDHGLRNIVLLRRS
jgi:hypothetical protein